MNRREFLQMMAAAYLVGFSDKSTSKNLIDYNIPFTSDLRLLHITDTHAQLAPTYFREPNINLGTGKNRNVPPHIVGDEFLKYYSLDGDFNEYVYSYMRFNELAERFGKFGGYAHLKTIIDKLRGEANGNSLLLDGGDTWQGSAYFSIRVRYGHGRSIEYPRRGCYDRSLGIYLWREPVQEKY
jgi:sulfur-oxidizing protein SoxB